MLRVVATPPETRWAFQDFAFAIPFPRVHRGTYLYQEALEEGAQISTSINGFNPT